MELQNKTTSQNSLLKNKWFILLKFLIPSFLLLLAIFALLASWRVGEALNTWKSNAAPEDKTIAGIIMPIITSSQVDTLKMWKALTLSFAIISIILVLFGFGFSKDPITVYSIMGVLSVFIIIVLTISILCITKSNSILINNMPDYSIFPIS